MPEHIDSRFRLERQEIPLGDAGSDVGKVQQYLQRFGYLQIPHETDRLDDATSDALRRFQQYMGLEVTGIVQPDTAAMLERPRCGVPDLPLVGRAYSGVPSTFVLSGCDYWPEFRTLSYAFVSGTEDIAGAEEQQAVASAFATWQREIPVDFVEVGALDQPNLTVGWFVGDHGDGAPFVGCDLAHAFYPPPCFGAVAGQLHFDDAWAWGLEDGFPPYDTESVALHEIGHLLGLAHSLDLTAVMTPVYARQRRALAQDDLDGIRRLYGRRGPALDVFVHLQDLGDRHYRDNELAGTPGQGGRLEGFMIRFDEPVEGLGLRYMAHLQGTGDVPFVTDGTFVGTRGESRRLEGFAIETTGTAADDFDVWYMAQLQDVGDTGMFRNGAFCGTRGESRRVEAILVRVEPK